MKNIFTHTYVRLQSKSRHFMNKWYKCIFNRVLSKSASFSDNNYFKPRSLDKLLQVNKLVTLISKNYVHGDISKVLEGIQQNIRMKSLDQSLHRLVKDPNMRDLVSPDPQFTVCVEGNIGSGKTTLLNLFSQMNDVSVLHEPVEKWRNLNGRNLLNLMYEDPQRWAHLFQTYVQLTMLEQHLQPSNKSVKLLERSLYSARHCFVENLHRSNKMTAPEYEVYCQWFNFIVSRMNVGIDLIVYLRTDPTVLHDRIKSRARSEESQIPLDYLQNLHDLHERWLLHDKDALPAPVLVIEANDDLSEMTKIYKRYSNQILMRQKDESNAFLDEGSGFNEPASASI